MSNYVNFAVDNDYNLTFFTPTGILNVPTEHPSYGEITRQADAMTEERLRELLDVNKALESFVTADCEKEGNKAVVEDGVVYYNGKPVHNAITKRINDFMTKGLPFSRLLRFLERIYQNPSARAVMELFDFLDRRGLPITEDGCFLALKAVRSDFKDKWSGTFDNSPGKVVEIERNQVDDDRRNECSFGLHCGAFEYVQLYGGGDDRLVVVKVDPADAVSVPLDYDATKLRTCRYEVLYEFTGTLDGSLYTSTGERVDNDVNFDEEYWQSISDDDEVEPDWDDDWDEEWEEDYEEDEVEEEDLPLPPPTSRSKVKPTLGVKPSGHHYHNKRDAKGRFSS